MTREKAVSVLRKYKRNVCVRHSCASFSCVQNRLKRCIYRNNLILELIQRIRNAEADPIETVREFIFMIEDVMAETDIDHKETLEFTQIMDDEACDIERMLIIIDEKEKQNEGN